MLLVLTDGDAGQRPAYADGQVRVAPRRRDSCACMRPAATTAARSCVCASPRVTPAARTAASCLRNGARSSGRDRAASRVLLARSSCSHSRMSRPKLSVPAPMERRVRRCWRTGASWPERAAAVDLVQVRERRRGLHDLHAPGGEPREHPSQGTRPITPRPLCAGRLAHSTRTAASVPVSPPGMDANRSPPAPSQIVLALFSHNRCTGSCGSTLRLAAAPRSPRDHLGPRARHC
jgi:hypothetical protein